MIGGRGGDGEKFILESRPICFGKLSAGADWKLNGIGRDGDNDGDVVRSSCGAGGKMDIMEYFEVG